jgi:hypothetical protein
LTSSRVCAAFLCKEERCSRQGGGLDGPHRHASNITRSNRSQTASDEGNARRRPLREHRDQLVSLDVSFPTLLIAPFVEALHFRTQSAIPRCISVLSFFVRTLCPAPEEAAQEQVRK